MIVTLKGMPDGEDLEYETGFHYFVDTVRLRIAEHNPPDVTPSNGAKPVNLMPTAREITFHFSHKIGERCIYETAPNAEVSGAGTASAGLPGYAGDNNGE